VKDRHDIAKSLMTISGNQDEAYGVRQNQ